MINPIVGFIVSMYYSLVGHKKVFFPLSISIVILYSYFPVLWDTRNNFYAIEYWGQYQNNFYNIMYVYLKKWFNLNYITFVFGCSVAISGIWNKLFYESFKGRETTFDKFTNVSLVIVFLLFFEFRYFFDIQRTFLAIVVSLFGSSIIHRNKFFGFAIYVFAFFIHPFSLFIPIAFILSSVFYQIGKPLVLLVFFLILGFSFRPFLLEILNILKSLGAVSDLVVRVDNYISNDSRIYSSDFSFYLVYIIRLSIIFFVVLLYSSYSDSFLYKNSVVIVCMSFIFISNDVFFERFYILITLMFYLMFIRLKIKKSHSVFVLMLFLFSFSLNNLNTLRIVFSDKYNEVIPNESFKFEMACKPVYLFTPLLLSYDFFGYSNDVILKEVKKR